MRQFVPAFALKQGDLFVAEERGEIAHGEFAFAGAGAREFGVVCAGADGDGLILRGPWWTSLGDLWLWDCWVGLE